MAILKYKISNYLPFNSSNNRSNEFKSEIKTSLAFAPLKPPTTPAASNWSIILPALLYPNFNCLCSIDVEPCCVETTILAPSSNKASFSFGSKAPTVELLSSPEYSGRR